ncbi:glucokinase [Desulfovibrio legallii]|jgi:glucokinase|uniref:Glucokinase n=1 Tax=Desulfovibrio legallii TaxID=571438 RepID=A0A1G7IYU4_9BACT|nr:glucokinase [Desulfovibrio legallii]SDF17785.1 glucokinase [Desulfovibrio legallii]
MARQRILAADIGGTNARFGCFSFEDGALRLERASWMPSAGLHDTEAALLALQKRLDLGIRRDDVLAMAVAGPVAAGRGCLTNGALRLDMAEARRLFGLRRCLLCNDFAAAALATLTPPGQSARLAAGEALPEAAGAARFAARAVLGAGTGLGAALLVWSGRRWLPVPSEAGHAAFPFVGRPEHDFERFLQKDLGQSWISAENVLSGLGLSQLHFFLSGAYLFPPVVGAEALSSETTTLQWYARFLARFCRNWMYAGLSLGGLWICGGIAARNPLCVTCPEFAAELSRAEPLRDLFAATPVRLMEDENSGLWGAARAGQDLVLRQEAALDQQG